MSVLSDHIEEFIKELMSEYEGQVELQRNELANYFSCAPSQINYVLATRFSPEQGYIIESRRGGGGYIRLVRMEDDAHAYLLSLIQGKLKEKVSLRDANAIIDGASNCGLLDKKQEKLMRAAVSDKAIKTPAMRDNVRAGVLKEMLLAVLGEEE